MNYYKVVYEINSEIQHMMLVSNSLQEAVMSFTIVNPGVEIISIEREQTK